MPGIEVVEHQWKAEMNMRGGLPPLFLSLSRAGAVRLSREIIDMMGESDGTND